MYINFLVLFYLFMLTMSASNDVEKVVAKLNNPDVDFLDFAISLDKRKEIKIKLEDMQSNSFPIIPVIPTVVAPPVQSKLPPPDEPADLYANLLSTQNSIHGAEETIGVGNRGGKNRIRSHLRGSGRPRNTLSAKKTHLPISV